MIYRLFEDTIKCLFRLLAKINWSLIFLCQFTKKKKDIVGLFNITTKDSQIRMTEAYSIAVTKEAFAFSNSLLNLLIAFLYYLLKESLLKCSSLRIIYK